jgi:hypothetical protein
LTRFARAWLARAGLALARTALPRVALARQSGPRSPLVLTWFEQRSLGLAELGPASFARASFEAASQGLAELGPPWLAQASSFEQASPGLVRLALTVRGMAPQVLARHVLARLALTLPRMARQAQA